MHIDRLDHLVLTVGDLERSVAFCRDVLGMQPVTFGGVSVPRTVSRLLASAFVTQARRPPAVPISTPRRSVRLGTEDGADRHRRSARVTDAAGSPPGTARVATAPASMPRRRPGRG